MSCNDCNKGAPKYEKISDPGDVSNPNKEKKCSCKIKGIPCKCYEHKDDCGCDYGNTKTVYVGNESCCNTGQVQEFPEYQEVNHCPDVIEKGFGGSFCVSHGFSIPNEASTIELIVPSLTSELPEGTTFYFGAFSMELQFSELDRQAHFVKLQAITDETKVTVGTWVNSPCFILGVPSNSITTTTSSTGTFLCTSFIVPAVDGTVAVEVSNGAGLLINDVIEVGNGHRFRIQSKPTTTQLTLINDGEGGAVGTTINAGCDCNTIEVTKISGETPCAKDAVESVDSLIGCDSGELSQLSLLPGEVPFKDPVSNKVIGKAIPGLEDCTTLTSCLKLDPDATTQEYLIDVADSSIFVKTNADDPDPLILIGTDEFIVLAVVDANTIRIEPAFTVSEFQDYDIGTSVCTDCCGALNRLLSCIKFSAIFGADFLGGGAHTPPLDISAVGEYYNPDGVSGRLMTITNPSPCAESCALLNVQATFGVDLSEEGTWTYDFLWDPNGVQPPTTLVSRKSISTNMARRRDDLEINTRIKIDLAPGETKTFSVASRINTLDGGTGVSTIGGMQILVNGYTIPTGV